MAAAGIPDAAAGSAISDEEVSALLEGAGEGAVKPFDMAARRVNRMQLPMLETVCKSFAEKMSAALSALINRDVAVHFSALDSAKAAELQAALPVPAALAIGRLKPLDGNVFMSVDPVLLLTLLDSFYGGAGKAAGESQTAIAPAAQRFLALLLRTWGPALTASFVPVAPLEFELSKLETNPRLMQLGAPHEPLLALRFAVEFGAQSGRIDWLVSEGTLEPIREALASDGGSTPVRNAEVWAPALGTLLQGAELEARAILTETRISLRELVRLMPGDIIPIEAPEHAVLLAGDVPLYHCRFGVSQGRNALKIISGGSR